MSTALDFDPLAPDLARIRAPHPGLPPHPWEPQPEPKRGPSTVPPGSGKLPTRTVRCHVLIGHMQGDQWHEPGSNYDAPEAAVSQHAVLGQVQIDPATDCDWFTEPPSVASRKYDGSLGPLVTVMAREGDVPVSLMRGGLWFVRNYPGVFWIPARAGDTREFSEAEAILLERGGHAEIVGELTERGRRFVEGLQAKKFNVYY